MSLIQGATLTFPASAFAEGNEDGVPSGYLGELLQTSFLGRYSTLVNAGKVFNAYAITTAAVIYSTAAGTGGPLIWNPPSSGVDVHLLGAGFAVSVVTTVATGLGITGAGGQSAAPTTTTAIDARGNCLVGGAASGATPYRIGTPSNAGGFFFPIAHVHTGALTVDNFGMTYFDLGGVVVAPPGTWVSIAAGATASTLQAQMSLLWAELPAVTR